MPNFCPLIERVKMSGGGRRGSLHRQNPEPSKNAEGSSTAPATNAGWTAQTVLTRLLGSEFERWRARDAATNWRDDLQQFWNYTAAHWLLLLSPASTSLQGFDINR